MKIKRYHIKSARTDLVPLIDIVFQLILFFLVATTFAILPGILLKLPDSQTADVAPSAGLTITADADGGLWLNGTTVTEAELSRQLAVYDTGGADRISYPVRLEADGSVTNSRIVALFDTLRRNGFSAVNLRTAE